MSSVSAVWRRAVIVECNRKKINYTDTTSTKILEKRLQAKEASKHKKNGILGRVPNIKKKLITKVLEKEGHGVTGTTDMLEERMKKHMKKKTTTKAAFYINKNFAPADEAQNLMGLEIGDVVEFKNGTKKKLIGQTTGGYRWKSA
jgi:hypothetical protein